MLHFNLQSAIKRKIIFKKCLSLMPISINHKMFTTSNAKLVNEVRVRFAPSPTGNLHIGGLRTAFYNYLFAKKHEGTFILRIEDTDRERLKKGSVDFLIESLDWSGIKADYGPHLKKDDETVQGAPWLQSKRLHLYKKYADVLLENKKAYRCFCDETRLELLRREATKRQEKISYDGKCRHLDESTVQKYIDEGRKSVVRFKLEERDIIFHDMTAGVHCSNPGKNEGDFVIMKSDGFPTYHFANVIDDHLMNISHVLRGQEWLLSTPKHIAIYDAFGWKAPKYGHLPLICNADGSKISKRQNDIDVLSYRDRGYFPETLLVYLSSIGGGLKTNVTQDGDSFFDNSDSVISKLADLFEESRISNRSVKLNQELLDRLNRRFLKLKLTDDVESLKLIRKLRSLLVENKENVSSKYTGDVYLKSVLNWSTERIFRLNDLVTDENFSYLWSDMSNFSISEIDEITKQNMLELIGVVSEYLSQTDLDENLFNDKTIFKKNLNAIIKELKKKSNLTLDKVKINYWQMIRQVLIGSTNGPPVFEIFNLFKKENIIYRLKIAEETLNLK